MSENRDDDIYNEIYEEYKDTYEGQDIEKGPKKKVRIRWDSIAILIMIIALIVLLIFLINNFRNESENSSGGSGEASGTSITGDEPSSDVQTTAVTSQTPDVTTTPEVTDPPPLYPVEADIVVVDGATYINGILIINKTYSVPESFAPGIDPVAEAKLAEMYSAAAADGLSMWTASGYRTYQYQQQLYENYAARDGYDAADTYSARPGFSEHESGLAFDVNDPSNTFDDTAEAQWLKEHCAEYGFIIRYPKGKEDITGFMYESWHIRYVGEEIATVIMENDICLEEYFGITSKYADDNIDEIIDQ